MSRLALEFANASCAHCARLVARSLKSVEGVDSVEVDRGGHRVLVDFDPTRLSPRTLQTVMERSGYPTRILPAISSAWLRRSLKAA